MSYGSKNIIIALSNETTASECLYEVSPEIANLLSQVTEPTLSQAMPRQTPSGMGYESVSYASALVEFAKAHGIANRDISIREVTIPTFYFDTGWDDLNCEPAEGDEGCHAHGLGENSDMSDSTAIGQAPMSQDEIRKLRQESDFIDSQQEFEDGRTRFVNIVRHAGKLLAIAPTFDTASLPLHDRVWEQPYEVRRIQRKVHINTMRWVPSDKDVPRYGCQQRPQHQ